MIVHNDNLRDVLPLRPMQIGLLPDMTACIRHDMKYTRPELDHQNGTSALLSARLVKQGIPVQFIDKPLLRLGRDQSHNKVYFGSLVSDKNNKTTSLEVAVKHRSLSGALGEAALNQYALDRGLYGFEPVGIVIKDIYLSQDPRAYLLTAFDKEIHSLDSVRLSDMHPDEINSVLYDASAATAHFHAQGLFHGDLELKNFAQKTTGEVVIIDLEHTVSALEAMTLATMPMSHLGHDTGMALNFVDRKVRSDFRSMKKSIGDLRPFITYSDARKLRIAKQAILDSYLGVVENSNGPFGQLLAGAAKRAFSTFRAEG